MYYELYVEGLGYGFNYVCQISIEGPTYLP